MAAKQLTDLTSEIARKEPEAIKLLETTYTRIFNETIQKGCGNCYQKAFFRIQKYLLLNKKTDMKDLKDRSYILKEGRSIQTEFGGDTLTNDNLTDKAAEKLLKANPSLAKHFEVLPEGLFDDSSKVKALTAPEIKSLVDGLSPEEKAAFLTSVNENITAKQPLVIKIEDTDRELTLKQLEKIAKENTPAQ